ncbi:hypothetical protein EBME_2279 [bacterium endosymbiont of Mortierella elongata FMR23-6]|nr:hypothetical protein EBME_2279 [bacterium endosymbiont of Mortierella elongata FMR23-6]
MQVVNDGTGLEDLAAGLEVADLDASGDGFQGFLGQGVERGKAMKMLADFQ